MSASINPPRMSWRAPQAGDDMDATLAHASILVVDDEIGMRNFLAKILSPRVKRLEEAGSPEEATRKLDAAHFDLVIIDNVMPGGTGLDWVMEQRQKGLFAETILITAYADLDTVIAALRADVSDFVLKPFRANQILGAVARTLDRKYLRRDNTLLRHALRADTAHGPLLGASDALAQVRNLLARLGPLTTPVLFTGATELARNWQHATCICNLTVLTARLLRSTAPPFRQTA